MMLQLQKWLETDMLFKSTDLKWVKLKQKLKENFKMRSFFNHVAHFSNTIALPDLCKQLVEKNGIVLALCLLPLSTWGDTNHSCDNNAAPCPGEMFLAAVW